MSAATANANALYDAHPGYFDDVERDTPWRSSVTWPDWLAMMDDAGQLGKRVDVVGCGPGGFAKYLDAHGFSVVGIDPAEAVCRRTHPYPLVMRPYESSGLPDQGADVVVMVDVLEHVEEPGELLRKAYSRLVSDGVLFVAVPNDYNALQLAVRALFDLPMWWKAGEHLHYFSFSSLTELVNEHGFDVAGRYTSFPMEAFALCGSNYPVDSDAGRACHERRVRIETDAERPRRLSAYRTLAEHGLGRHAILVCTKR